MIVTALEQAQRQGKRLFDHAFICKAPTSAIARLTWSMLPTVKVELQ